MGKVKKVIPPNPRESAGAFSLLTFLWTIPIFRKGYQKPIEIDDLYDALKKDKSNIIGDTLEGHYLKDVERCEEQRKAMGIMNPAEGPQASLCKALFRTFWPDLLFVGSVNLFSELMKLLPPFLLGRLLQYFAPQSTTEHWQAVAFGAGIVVCTATIAIALNHYMMAGYHLGMRARVAVCSLIYRKSLRLSRNALGESAPGKVVNLLSNDVNRFDMAAALMHYLWIAPLISILVMYFLWREVGISGVLGILLVFTVMPIQAYAGKLSAKFRLQTALKTDERVRFMGEIISGVQVIKMYVWEKPFQALITLARRLEIKAIRKISYVRAVFMTFLLITTRTAVFFVMLSMVLMGQKLTAAKVFVVAAYFKHLSAVISMMFVRAIAEVAEVIVALKRLQKYLNQEEFHPNSSTIILNSGTERRFSTTLTSKVRRNSRTVDGLSNGDVLKDDSMGGDDKRNSVAIKISKAEAKWDADKTKLTLDLDQMELKKGRLIGIIGPVGSGKSSLLQAVLGELPLQKGSVEVRGSISYACQESWVFGASVRQNIIFGLPYEKARYNEVVRVCALQTDFGQFPFGDQTLVGERGASLSGGQKARINLARAVYRQADIYLLDDPLSAVDAHVGRQLFEQCIVLHLRHRTRLLVTHQLHYLKDADHIIVLQNGRIELQGSYQDLTSSTLEYAQLLLPSLSVGPEEGSEQGKTGRRSSTVSITRSTRRALSRMDSLTVQRNRGDSVSSSILELNDLPVKLRDDSEDEGSDTDEEEQMEQQAAVEASSRNTVPGSVGLQYLTAGTRCLSLLLIVGVFIASQISVSAGDYWMSFWTSQEELRDYYNNTSPARSTLMSNSSSNEAMISSDLVGTTVPSFSTESPYQETFFINDTLLLENDNVTTVALPEYDSLLSTNTCMMIHGIIMLLAFLITLLRSFSFFNLAMRSSQALHDIMFRGIIRSPMKFFNDNPSGRIMNRFAKDMGAIDELLPKAILDASQVLLQMVGAIVLSCYVNPYFIIPILIIGSIFLVTRKLYLKTSKNIKRIEGISRSPVFTHLSTTLQGLSTIRAYGAQQMLKDEFDHLQNVHTSAWYMFISTSLAFGFLLDYFCLVLIAIVIFSFLLFSTKMLGHEVGLAITQCMSLSFMVQWGIRQSAEVANQLMGVERILEYSLLPAEKGVEPDEIDRACKTPQAQKVMSVVLRKPPVLWPEEGQIVFKDLSLKYTDNPDDPYILEQLCCEIKSHEKVGIVGRTGAGKSSLISALFRLAFNEGVILIDKQNTESMSLADLRKKISIIPQDPVLFSGTVRRNLDPFEEYSDADIWLSLEAVELKDVITGPVGLESKVMDGGSNFSVGQRQLMCLARALLRKNNILVLDEATANVDPHTDNLIQKTIREKFVDCTVLTIAHRLNTIMDSNRVMVMDQGAIVEFDHPYILLQRPDGFLTKMVTETGKQNADQLFNVAKDNYGARHMPVDI